MEQREFVRMSSSNYFAFLAVVAFVHFTPGPVMMTLSLHTVNRGLKAGLLTLVGVEIAELLLLAIVVLGLGKVASSLSQAMHWVVVFGIAYLVYAAICAWRVNPHLPQRPPKLSGYSALSGFAVTISDPISILFYGSLFPQFIDWQQPVGPQFLVLALSYLLLAIVFDFGIVLLSSRVPRNGMFKISAITKKNLNAAAQSLVACIVMSTAYGNFVFRDISVAEVKFESVVKGDLVSGNQFARNEAGMAVLIAN